MEPNYCAGCSDMLDENNEGPDPLFCTSCVTWKTAFKSVSNKLAIRDITVDITCKRNTKLEAELKKVKKKRDNFKEARNLYFKNLLEANKVVSAVTVLRNEHAISCGEKYHKAYVHVMTMALPKVR
jgi:hypothetical protein